MVDALQREHAKYNVNAQNKILFQITLLVIVALILQIVRNAFQTFHLGGSIWFRYQFTVPV